MQEVEAFGDFGVMPEIITALEHLKWGYEIFIT